MGRAVTVFSLIANNWRANNELESSHAADLFAACAPMKTHQERAKDTEDVVFGVSNAGVLA